MENFLKVCLIAMFALPFVSVIFNEIYYSKYPEKSIIKKDIKSLHCEAPFVIVSMQIDTRVYYCFLEKNKEKEFVFGKISAEKSIFLPTLKPDETPYVEYNKRYREKTKVFIPESFEFKFLEIPKKE